MVTEGVTACSALALTGPIPWLILAVSAFVTVQLRVAEVSSVIVPESVVNESITGRVFTVTVTLSVLVLFPSSLVAVMV